MGGQTALNVAMALLKDGILEKYGVELIGANERAIRLAEDRSRVRRGDGADRARDARRARWCARCEEALAAVEKTGYPAIMRPSFTLGGTGGGIAYNREESSRPCWRAASSCRRSRRC